ncbi:MAG: class I SAM-dependent methyltransferase [Bdellovibrionales bacterium]|nr:class I SAM-dependent methyltransferase [Bdellovibrionales bacterium]
MGKQAFYPLYERAVQTPEVHADFFGRVHAELCPGREPVLLREDFCGSFLVSCAWVKSGPRHRAVAVDLDADVLSYGRRANLRALKPSERRRLRPLRSDVLKATRPAADIVAACNFSFYVFLDRKTLVRYFKQALRSLRPGGLIILEMSGGPGMMEHTQEKRRVRLENGKHFTYYWDQKRFDPVSFEGRYAIHFKTSDGRLHRDVFTYHWRLWTIPEVRAALEEAGFSASHVYWEDRDSSGELTGEFQLTSRGENDHAWISYVVGVR